MLNMRAFKSLGQVDQWGMPQQPTVGDLIAALQDYDATWSVQVQGDAQRTAPDYLEPDKDKKAVIIRHGY